MAVLPHVHALPDELVKQAHTIADYARKELLEKVMENVGVEADMYEAFGPVRDMRKGSKMGFLDKRFAKSVMLGLSKEQRIEFDIDRRNDLRDWDKIEEFADIFASLYMKKQQKSTEFVRSFLDLTALSTISDIMPLVDENRIIGTEGGLPAGLPKCPGAGRF